MSIYLTKNGKSLLYERIEKLEKELVDIRAEKAIAYTVSGDTWHDNPGFNALEQSEHRKATEIYELNKKIEAATICDISIRNTSSVKVGSIVRCVRYTQKNDDQIFIWEIVGLGESDPSQLKISYDSPVGSVLMGLSVHEESEKVFIPSEKMYVTYEILKFYLDWKEVGNEK